MIRPVASALVGACAVLLPLLSGMASVSSAQTNDRADYAVPGGWFYTQANGLDGARTYGFSVIDDSNANFYSEFNRIGGVPVVGYPISARFMWDGYETQAFQKLVFQWRPATKSVLFVNVFDKMSEANKDNYLLDKRGIPSQKKFDEVNKPLGEIQRDRLKILDERPNIKKFYMTVPGDALVYNGLPTSPIEDINNAYVLRAQRIVLQEWKVNVPWARAGDVTAANGGDVAKETGLLPDNAIRPRNPDGSIPPGNITGTPPAGAAAGAPAAPAATAVPTSAPLVAVQGPIKLSLSLDGPMVSGGEGKVKYSVVDKNGRGVPNALVTILVHFPLGPGDVAYAPDLSAIVPTGADGTGVHTFKIPAAVPRGTGITVEATALYPPEADHMEIGASLS